MNHRTTIGLAFGSALAISVIALQANRAAELLPGLRPSLKAVFAKDFLIGAAINRSQFFEEDKRGVPIIQAQFNSITPENILKWESVHPRPGEYNFEGPDRYVAFGESNHMTIIGHTLVWHHQTPRWVFQNEDGTPVSRDTLLARLHEHIQTVVGRYRGRIKGWDVVNEAVNEDGSLRQSPWLKIIGEDYVVKAFQFAHEADPNADLHYNDYALEDLPKRKGAIELLTRLKAQGVVVTAIGLQDHIKLDWPTPEQEDATITTFANLGLKVMITELDVDVVPATQSNRTADISANAQTNREAGVFAEGLPEATQQALAKRYAAMFGVFLKHRGVITRVTFWGVTDGDSWLNSRGRVNYPLLFDRNGKPKPAFGAVIRAAIEVRQRN